MSDVSEKRPPFIPDHAQGVTRLSKATWVWEFAGGAVVYLGQMGSGIVQLEGATLEHLVAHLGEHQERYRTAITNERARQEAYEEYLRGVDYEPDEDDLEGL